MYKIILLIDISEEYGQNLTKGIVKYSKEHGPWVFCKMPLFYRETHGVEGIVRFAKEWGADGIIAHLDNDLDIKKIHQAGISLIVEDFKERFEGLLVLQTIAAKSVASVFTKAYCNNGLR